MDGWMAGWLDGWMVGWLDGWMVGWLYGWMIILLALVVRQDGYTDLEEPTI